MAIVNAECRALVAAGAQFVQIEASQIVLEFANREHHLERLRVAPGG